MEKILKLYTYVDGTNDTPFPSADEQVIIGSFTYTANRMGGAPTISATVKHRLCLDDIWNDKVYAEFNGEKYFVVNTPSSSKSNDDTRYEHDLELLSEREILNHVYFIDAVQGDSDTDVYKSNSTKVLFYGDIQQFVARLNASLSYRNLGYTAVIDDGITSEDKQVSFEDKYILEALQEEFNIFEIPYYFVGKAIHFGYTSNAITTTFKYGHDDAFLSISKDNANYAIINRITGVGSSDNIPYYYPNETDDQSAVEASGKKWITPSQNLMPSIYRESEGAEMFYEAKNNTYPDGEGGYYQFENEYSGANPREGKTDFEDIKPTITGITNAAGQRIDMFVEFAYDTNDNDEVDEEGNYLHPYFFAKLKKTDGTYGFNLFDHAIESQTMQITFTSGICGACMFEIAVGEDTQKNLVQVGETSGALMRDEDGNVLCGREDLQQPQTPQDRQNDTKNYEVWIALRKDNSTYPQVMPNVNYNYKPSTSDTFAILGISLPQAYILKAEDELEKSLVKHMWMNNVEKFTFSAKFSRIFFTEHPEVLAQLNENARVIIEYNGKQHTLYIDNYSYKMDASSPLPEIDVDLVDTLSVGQNSLQTQLDSVKQDILSSIGGSDFLKNGLKYFLRKDTADTARGKITFVRGIDVGTFSENTSGGTFRVLEDLTTYAEVDKLRVRVKAYFETLEIINTNSVGGKMILTAGGGVYLREVKDRETLEDGTEQVWDFYRCYFLTEQDGREVENRFHVGDLAMSQSFNIKAGTHQGVTNHYYWREVVGIGDDYIDLSKTICDTGSDAPMAEDTVCHLGNRSDKDRQGAIIFSAVDVFSPSITLYYGINDFSLVNKDYVSYGVDKSTGNAFFRVYGEMYAGDREQTSYVKYTPGFGVEVKGTFITRSGENVEDQISQAIAGAGIETWFEEHEPTLDNYPASEWTTDEEKDKHLGDLFYSGTGKAYMFVYEGNTYQWKLIEDEDIKKALEDAAKALEDAENARKEAEEAKYRLDQWAADGVISPTEKQSLKDEIARIDADREEINGEYAKYGLGTPTQYNNAYTNYRNLLVSLSASTPENIPIPDHFATAQASYYNYRTQAYDNISTAARNEVQSAKELIEQVQEDVNGVKEDINTVKESVDGMKNFTDQAFADGIIDRSESTAIASYIQNIETFVKDAQESYTKVYGNPLLSGTWKQDLKTAYDGFIASSTELTSTIEGVIEDGIVDNIEKASVDGKYAAFNTKYGDFIAAINAANKAIQDAINQNALDALRQIGEYSYLKDALKEATWWEGGLLQSSILALGYTSDTGRRVMAGTSGIYDSTKLGGGIASWWGGEMYDRFEYNESNMPENVAAGVIRMDGTGYLANGNLWWESDGTLHADPLSFFVGEETVGDVLGLFQFVKSDAGIEYVIPQYPFQKLEIGNYLQIGKAQLYWDEANQAFYVRHQDGVSPVGFYATGFISTKGANPNAGGTVSGASSLDELSDVSLSGLQDGQVLAYDTATQKWVNKSVSAGGMDEEALEAYLTENQYAKKSDISIAGLTDLHSSWDALLKAQKPTSLAGYGIADGVNNVSVTGSGNAVTAASVSGHTLTLTKGSTFLLSSAYTAADILNKLKTVDGSGSGLDADLLDGTHKTGLLTSVASSSTTNLSVAVGGTTKSVADLHATYLDGLSWSSFSIQRIYTVSTSGLSTSNFYPIFFTPGVNDLHVEIHSQGGIGSAAYNTNRLNCIIHANGWDDSGKSLTILTSSVYDTNEITIGAIGYGTRDGGVAIWVRGGIGTIYIRSNFAPYLKTSNYTYGDCIFTVGTNLSGGTNTNVSIMWQNNENRNNNVVAYLNSNVASATQLRTARTIWGQPFDGTAPVSGNMTGVGDISFAGMNRLYWKESGWGDQFAIVPAFSGGDDSNMLQFQSATGGAGTTPALTTKMVIAGQSGNVGIGTTSLSYKLNVAGDIYSTTSFRLGSGTITWDATNNCFHFSHGLYSDSFVSAKGANSGSGGTVSGVTKLSDLSDVQLGTLATNQVLSWNGSKWVNKAISTGLDETALAQYLTNNQYLTMPTGDARYVKKAGDTMTGLLTLKTQASHTGLKLSNTYLTAIEGNVIFQNNNSLRFGSDNWDYSTWAGLKYNHSSKYIYLGIADGSIFQANSAQSGGSILTPGISNIFVGNNTTNKVWHAGNDGSGSGLDADLLDGYNASSFESYRLVTINASSLNQNTWYPVTMAIGNSQQTRIRIEGNSSANASWNPRADKHMSLILDYTVNGSLWGWTGAQRVIYQYMEGQGTSSCLRGLGQLINSSTEYVFVRGGAVYNFYVSRFITPVLRTSTYTVSEQSVSPTTTAPAAISRTNALITDNVYSATQLQTARTINGTAFNGTSNIVTSYWGTARTLSLTGNATGSVSMNGSSNVSMSVNVNYATSAGNASTLGGTSKAGLFTALSSSNATNLSVTIGGTTKSITDLYANYAVSAGNADTLDNLHSSSFFRYIGNNVYSNWNDMTAIGTMRVTEQSITNGPSGAYNYGQLVTFNAGGTLTQLYFPHSTVGAYIRTGWSGVSQYYSWQQLATINSNVYSATKLQTAQNIWGRPFDGTAPVSGNMTGVGSITGSGDISMSGSITAGAYVYSSGWFQNQQSGEGLYNNAVDARWYANSSGWISDKKINANAGLGVSGTTTLGGAVQVPYSGSTWIGMATRTNLIYSTTNNSTSAAHALYRVKANNGNALCFGGLGNGLGFYAFTAANISSGTNVVWKNTYWDMTNWKLTHGGALAVAGAVTFSSTLAVTGAITGSSTIYAKTGMYSDGYVSAKGNNSSSDIRLKNILSPVHPSLKAFAKAPLFRFAWKSNPGMVEIGSSAQYWRNVLPDTVKEREGWLEMGYGNIALAGVITIAREVETLEQRVDRLEKENGKLKKRIKELERRSA